MPEKLWVVMWRSFNDPLWKVQDSIPFLSEKDADDHAVRCRRWWDGEEFIVVSYLLAEQEKEQA